jgi:Cys-rich protein (TIGR04453 family)
MRLVLVFLLATACGGSSKADREICQRAADRYTQCVGEVLGEEAKAMVSAPEKDGRDQCAADPRTVDAYKKCLPKQSCNEFMDCVMDLAMAAP